MTRPLTVALTETCNVYREMPARPEEVATLGPRLEDIRRANVEHHVGLIEAAAKRGAKLVGLGELFAAPYFALRKDPVWHAMAEDAAWIGARLACTRPDGLAIMLRALASVEAHPVVASVFRREGGAWRANQAFVPALVAGPVAADLRRAEPLRHNKRLARHVPARPRLERVHLPENLPRAVHHVLRVLALEDLHRQTPARLEQRRQHLEHAQAQSGREKIVAVPGRVGSHVAEHCVEDPAAQLEQVRRRHDEDIALHRAHVGRDGLFDGLQINPDNKALGADEFGRDLQPRARCAAKVEHAIAIAKDALLLVDLE